MQGLENFKNKLNEIIEEYNRICELLCYEEVLLDKKLFLNYSHQKQKFQPIIEKYEEYKNLQKSLIELNDFKNNLSLEEKILCDNEILDIQLKTQRLELEIKKFILDFNGELNQIVIEIIAGKDDISKELFLMLIQGYENYCKNNRFNYDICKSNNNAKLNILGLNAEVHFKNEIGLHLVKNVDKEGTCQVFVYKINNEEISFEERDIEIITCRSSGAGGQHINTTDSAIKITHLKTGISAICQDERSQFQNKQKALERLKEKVFYFLNKQQNNLIEKQKKEQIKKIKTNRYVKIYNFENGKFENINKQEYTLKDFLLGKIL